MFKYKVDVIAELKANGYNTNKIRKEKLLSESVLTALRNNEYVSMRTLDRVCCLLHKQPWEIVEFKF